MSELNTAVDQPQQTADAASVPEPFAWMDEPSSSQADASTETPEPIEAGASPEEGESSNAEPETAEAQSPQSRDEWFGSLTDEEHAYYAKRYPTLYNAYQQSDQPADLRQAFKDRVNQDRKFEELRTGRANSEEPTLEDESEQDAVPQITDPKQLREHWYAQVDALVNEAVDPQAVQDLGTNLLKGFGVDITSTDPEVQALVKNAPEVGKTLTRGAVDLMATVLPRILPNVIEQLYPGTAENFERQTYASAWEAVRQSNPEYAKLPAYGRPDGEFGKLMREAAAKIPNFDRMQFPGTLQEQAFAKYQILAQAAMGQKATPAAVAKAVETGKQIAKAQTKNLQAGRALGAGKSTNAIDNGKNDNSFRSWIEEYNAEQRSTPLKG